MHVHALVGRNFNSVFINHYGTDLPYQIVCLITVIDTASWTGCNCHSPLWNVMFVEYTGQRYEYDYLI